MSDSKTVKEILEEDNLEDTWIWESIIKAKTINILSGDESSGKSTLMINLCNQRMDVIARDIILLETKTY